MGRLVPLVILLACSTPAVWAQEAAPVDDSLRRAPVAQQVVMGIGGHWASGTTSILSGALVAKLSTSSEAGVVTGLALYPLGVAATSYGIGHLFGTDGQFEGTLRGAYIGAGIGAVLGISAGALVLSTGPSGDYPDSFVAGIAASLGTAVMAASVAVLFYAGGTMVGSVRGYNASVAPAVVSSTTGAARPGFRVALSF